MSTPKQTLADLVEARDYFKQEAADCRRASESAAGDRGWWSQRASKYDRFADAIDDALQQRSHQEFLDSCA